MMRIPERSAKPTNMNKKHYLNPIRMIARAALVVSLCGVATLAFAQSNNRGTGKKYVATEEIIFDKATNKLRKPTFEETQAMVEHISAITNRSSEGLTGKQLPNGATQVNLKGRFGGVAVGRAHADGTTEVRCVTSMEEAAAFLGLEEVK
jgi:hypothetical protein